MNTDTDNHSSRPASPRAAETVARPSLEESWQRGGGPPPDVAPPLLPSTSISPAPAAPLISPSFTPPIADGDRPADGAELGAARAPLSAASTLAAPSLLPPTLTPATTTRQAISLGVFSTLWGSDSTQNTHISSAQESPGLDLAASSTSSVPSTTTTLTNTLPPTQSAALRALNAPAFQSSLHPSSSQSPSKPKGAKSASSHTTLSSQPVVVRTYSGPRHKSRHSTSSAIASPRYINMDRPRTSPYSNANPSALSAGLADARYQPKLPSVDSFSFSAILRAVDPEIRDAIDAIAEICARSRYSLADEYDAHLPPQGEITAGDARAIEALTGGSGSGRTTSNSSSSRGRLARIGQGWSAATAERTLVTVPEASSASERSAPGEGSRRSSIDGKMKRSQSAYGSLKSVISGGSGSGGRNSIQRRKSVGPGVPTEIVTAASFFPTDSSPSKRKAESPPVPTWSIINTLNPSTRINASSSASPYSLPRLYRPAITVTSPRASNHLSLDTSSTIKHIPADDMPLPSQSGSAAPRPQTSDYNTAVPPSSRRHTRNASSGSALAALTAWVPLWTGRSAKGDNVDRGSGSRFDRERDENTMLGEVKERLRVMLKGDGATG